MSAVTEPTPVDSYDAIVVGAGPAGSAAAYTLASKKIKVCLVDKMSFPRDKLCGGLITLRSKTLLSSIFNSAVDDSLFFHLTMLSLRCRVIRFPPRAVSGRCFLL